MFFSFCCDAKYVLSLDNIDFPFVLFYLFDIFQRNDTLHNATQQASASCLLRVLTVTFWQPGHGFESRRECFFSRFRTW